VILHKEIRSVMAFKEVFDCETLVTETERHPLLHDCGLIRSEGQTVWRRVRGHHSVCSQLPGAEKYETK
jgi:hypothetical protein